MGKFLVGVIAISFGCFSLLFAASNFFEFMENKIAGIVPIDDPAVLNVPFAFCGGIFGLAFVVRYRPLVWLFAVALFPMGMCIIVCSVFIGSTPAIVSAIFGVLLVVPLILLVLGACKRKIIR